MKRKEDNGSFASYYKGGGYSSELEEDQSAHPPKDDISAVSGQFQFKKPVAALPSKQTLSGISNRESNKACNWGESLRGMNAYDRHVRFINDFVLFYNRGEPFKYEPSKPYKTDHDVLQEQYRFIRSEEDDDDSDWSKRLAKKYYDKLFKEYCLADMSRYKEGKIGLRWRTQDEVFKGKGQFICGNKKCDRKDDLKSYEVNFAYVEAKEKKNALVKLRTCPECAFKLNYKSIKRQQKEQRKQEKKRRKLEEKRPVQDREDEDEDDNPSDDLVAQQALQEAHRKAAEEQANKQKLADAWKQKPDLEKTKEEEIDEYFEGMFL